MKTFSEEEARKLLLAEARKKLYGSKPISDDAFAKDLGIGRTTLSRIRNNGAVGEKSLDTLSIFVTGLPYNAFKKQMELAFQSRNLAEQEALFSKNFNKRLDALKTFVSEIRVKTGLFKQKLKGNDFFIYAQNYINERSDWKFEDPPHAPLLELGFPHTILYEELMVNHGNVFRDFFRLIDAIFSELKRGVVEEKTEMHYAEILKSELSESQVFCMLLYAIPPEGHHFNTPMRHYYLMEKIPFRSLPYYKTWIQLHDPIFEDHIKNPSNIIKSSNSIWGLNLILKTINDLLNISIAFWNFDRIIKTSWGYSTASENFKEEVLESKQLQFGLLIFKAIFKPNHIVIRLEITSPEIIKEIYKDHLPSLNTKFLDRFLQLDICQFISDIMFDRLILRNLFSFKHISLGKIKIDHFEKVVDMGTSIYEVSYYFTDDFFHFPINYKRDILDFRESDLGQKLESCKE